MRDGPDINCSPLKGSAIALFWVGLETRNIVEGSLDVSVSTFDTFLLQAFISSDFRSWFHLSSLEAPLSERCVIHLVLGDEICISHDKVHHSRPVLCRRVVEVAEAGLPLK